MSAFSEILLKGGLLIWPIGLCSVLSIAILLERLWSLRERLLLPADLLRRSEKLLKDRQYDALATLAADDPSPAGRLIQTATTHHALPRAELQEALEEVGHLEGQRLGRFLEGLSTIASVSPLLGLLGTVTGMITVFQKVTEEGVGDPRILASGIWEALITTAAGIAVAIPALIFHRYLSARVDGTVVRLEELAIELLETIRPRGAQTEAPASDDGGA